MDVLVREHFGLPHPRDQSLWGGHDSKQSGVIAAEAPQLGAALSPYPANVPPTRDAAQVRSLSEITGHSIEATDSNIGHAEDFLIDTALWHVRYMTVHTSSWWPGEKVLVSPRSVDWIDWARSIIHLDVTRQKVKDSPPYVAAETVDGAFEELFYSYYGIRGPRR